MLGLTPKAPGTQPRLTANHQAPSQAVVRSSPTMVKHGPTGPFNRWEEKNIKQWAIDKKALEERLAKGKQHRKEEPLRHNEIVFHGKCEIQRRAMEQFAVLGEDRREIVAWWYERTLPERRSEAKRRKEEQKKWVEFEKEVMRVEAERNKKLQKQLRKQLHESQKQLCEATKREEEAKEEFMLQTWLQKAKKRNAEATEELRQKQQKRGDRKRKKERKGGGDGDEGGNRQGECGEAK